MIWCNDVKCIVMGWALKNSSPSWCPALKVEFELKPFKKVWSRAFITDLYFFATWKIQSFRPFSKSWARAWIEPGQFSKYQALKKLPNLGSDPALKMHYSMVMDIFTEHLLCQWDIKLLKMSRLPNRIQGRLVGPGGLLLKKCTTKVDLLVVVQNK